MTDTQHYRDRIAELEEEVRQLREIVKVEDRALELRFGLTPTEGRILRVLAKGGVWSRDKLSMLCCKNGTDADAIGVHMMRVRAKIAPVKITVSWGMGYAIEGESLDMVRAIIAGESPAAALAS